MALGYRSVLRLNDNDNAIEVAESQLHAWLNEKRKRNRSTIRETDWSGEGVHRLGEQVALTVVHADGDKDASLRRLYRLEESNSYGTFVVSIFATSFKTGTNKQTLVIDLDMRDTPPERSIWRVDPPNVVARILDSIEAWDGRLRLHGTPPIVRDFEVEDVYEALVDQERVASLVIAPSPGLDVQDRWREVVASLTRQSVGVAATLVLDPAATDALNNLLPYSHRLEPGVVRTFAPNVVVNSPEDGLRHRMLGPATLSRSIENDKVSDPLRRRHAEAMRRRLLERQLPVDVRRSINLLSRAESVEVRRNAARMTDADVSPGVQGPGGVIAAVDERIRSWARSLLVKWSSVDRYDDQEPLGAISRLVGERTYELQFAEKQFEELGDELILANQTNVQLREALEEAELDAAIAEESSRQLERENSLLRRRLVRVKQGEDAYVAPIDGEWSAPASLEELVQRITPGAGSHKALTLIEFTGDMAPVTEIDAYDSVARYASAFWDYIHVLYDFAAQKSGGYFSGNVHMYLNDDLVDGHKCSPQRHAGTESDSVKNNKLWYQERMLPVPQNVDPLGRVFMGAHFKPTHRDTVAPRMHYYDDLEGTGKVYVGYIGRHLTNTKS